MVGKRPGGSGGSLLIQPSKRSASLAKLTAKQRLFCHHLTNDREFNVTGAAKKAGYRSPGISGSTLMRKREVAQYVGKCLWERAKVLEVSAERVLSELVNLGFMKGPKALVDKTGVLIPLHELPDEVSAAISSIKVKQVADDEGNTCTTYEVKWWNKVEALELIGKHLAMFDSRLNITSDIGDNLRGAISDALGKIESRTNGTPTGIIDAIVVDPMKIESNGEGET